MIMTRQDDKRRRKKKSMYTNIFVCMLEYFLNYYSCHKKFSGDSKFLFFSLCVHRSSSNSSILCDNFIILLYRDKHGHTHQMSSIERKKEKKIYLSRTKSLNTNEA